jgi:hypothetical protein
MKIDELDVPWVDEEMKAAYWELLEESCKALVEDGTLKEFCHAQRTICTTEVLPDSTMLRAPSDPVESP